MSEASSLPANSELADTFNEEAKSPSIWHRIHVGLNGIHEGVSHVVGDVAGAVAAVPGLVVDVADMGAEMIGKDLYEGSATRDFFSATQEWTKENVGEKVAYVIVPPAAVADALNGFERAEILDETDQIIFSSTEITTRVVGDAAVVAGAIVLSGGTVTGALAATGGAIKTTAGAVGSVASLKGMTLIGAGYALDRFVLPTEGAITHGLLQIPEKGAEIIGWDRGAEVIDTTADYMETSLDNEENPQPTFGEVHQTIRGDVSADDGGLGSGLGDFLPKDKNLSAIFNFLGGGDNNSLLSTIGFGLGGMLLGSTVLGKFMGNSSFTGILSIGIALVAAFTLPNMFKRLALKTDPDVPSEEETAVESPETDASSEEDTPETSALKSEYDSASTQPVLPPPDPQSDDTHLSHIENTENEESNYNGQQTPVPAPAM